MIPKRAETTINVLAVVKTSVVNNTNFNLKADKGSGRSVPDQGSPDTGICGYFKEG